MLDPITMELAEIEVIVNSAGISMLEKDSIQQKIDIINSTLKIYGQHIDDMDIGDPYRSKLINKYKLEEQELEKLKKKHPEYFI